MGISRRALLQTTCMVALTLAMWPAKSFGTVTLAGENFYGNVTAVNPSFPNYPNVKAGDWITGTFTYDSSQTGTSGLYTFTGTSAEPTAESFAIRIWNSASETLQYDSDSFSGNNTSPGDYFTIKLNYRTVANGGTTMVISADTIGSPANPAVVLTLTDPTNAYTYGTNDTLTGTYSATNLPLPDQNTLTKDFTVSTTKPGTLTYGDPLCADIIGAYPLGGVYPLSAVPEPSTMVLVVVSVAIGTAGSWVSRRRRRRLSST